VRQSLLAGALLIAGCQVFDQACTLIGCLSGLSIQFAQAQTAAYRIDVRVPGQPIHATSECPNPSQSPCGTAFFPNFTPTTVEIIITTGTGTQAVTRTITAQPQYFATQPNGPDCGPACTQGTVMIQP
jgi:hypothetical protein